MATDFAQFEHEQLIAMLDGNTPPLILSSADSFHSLAIRVDRSARSLAARVRDLDWRGESAEAFKQWAHDVLRAAGELSEFVRETGQQLRTAGEQLAGTQLPAVNAADQMLAKSQDETARANALQRLSAAKSEAVRQMQALGSTYRVAAENLSTLKEPRFPQPANLLGLRVQALEPFTNSEPAVHASTEGRKDLGPQPIPGSVFTPSNPRTERSRPRPDSAHHQSMPEQGRPAAKQAGASSFLSNASPSSVNPRDANGTHEPMAPPGKASKWRASALTVSAPTLAPTSRTPNSAPLAPFGARTAQPVPPSGPPASGRSGLGLTQASPTIPRTAIMPTMPVAPAPISPVNREGAAGLADDDSAPWISARNTVPPVIE